MRHRWARGHAGGAALSDAYVQLGNDLADFISGRLCFILRRHFAGIDFLHDLGPDLTVHAGFEVARQLIQPQITLGFLGAMTRNAVFLQKTFKRLGCVAKAHNGDKQENGNEPRPRALRAQVADRIVVEELGDFLRDT